MTPYTPPQFKFNKEELILFLIRETGQSPDSVINWVEQMPNEAAEFANKVYQEINKKNKIKI